MQLSPGPHTLNVTQPPGESTVVTVPFDAAGFNAFGQRFTYKPAQDWYESEDGSMHVGPFSGPPSIPEKVFAGNWNARIFGGTWL